MGDIGGLTSQLTSSSFGSDERWYKWKEKRKIELNGGGWCRGARPLNHELTVIDDDYCGFYYSLEKFLLPLILPAGLVARWLIQSSPGD